MLRILGTIYDPCLDILVLESSNTVLLEFSTEGMAFGAEEQIQVQSMYVLAILTMLFLWHLQMDFIYMSILWNIVQRLLK